MKELFDNYYKELFSQNKSQRLDLRTFELTARKFRWNYKRFFIDLPKEAKILDFGCGTGQFLYFLKKEGFQYLTGIDISKSQIDIALQMQPKLDLKYSVNPSIFLEQQRELYDVIVMNDVLEHIEKENIISMLRIIYQSLKPGGMVIIKTINSAYPLSHASRYLDLTHTISFHERSITQLLRHTGFNDIFCYQEEIGIYNPLFAIKKIIVILMRIFVKILIYLTESDWPRIISVNLIASGVKR